MPRQTVAAKITKRESPGGDTETIEKHPAYGMIRVSRVSGNSDRPLYGSSISHHHTIRLTVTEGERKRNLSEHWYHDGPQIVEVEMSATQFADLLTNMNNGCGVPCTLLWRENGGTVPEMEKHESDRKHVQEEFDDHVKRGMEALTKLIRKASEIAANPKPTKADREEYSNLAQTIHREIVQNLPFIAEQFNESCDKLVKEAKGEYEAAVLSSIAAMGLGAFKDKLLAQNAPSMDVEALPPAGGSDVMVQATTEEEPGHERGTLKGKRFGHIV